MSRIRTKLAKEFERKAAKCVGSVETEYRKKLRLLNDKHDMQSNEKMLLLEEMSDLKEKLDFLNKQNMEMKKEEKARIREEKARDDENERMMEGCLKESKRLLLENQSLMEKNGR